MLKELLFVLKYGAIIGLVPYACSNQQKQQQQQQHLHWQQIYTLLLLSAHCLLTLYAVMLVPLQPQIASDFVSLLVYLHQVLAMSVILLEVMLTYEQHAAFVQQSERLEQLFRQQLQLQLRLCGRSLRRRQLRYFLLLQAPVAYGCLLVGITVISLVPYTGYFWYGLPAVLIIRTRCLQAMLYVDYIVCYLDMLNLKLRGVYSCKVAQRRDYLDVNYAQLESLDYLLALKRIYKEIHEFTLIFNELFGWSLVIALTVIFFDMVANIYWGLLTLCNVYHRYYLYMSIFTFLPLIVVLIMLCHSCEQCQLQCSATASLVQRLQKTSRQDVNAKLYSDLVNEFSLQIMQERIEICPKAFCRIDLRLLTEIFVAMATHLVILMQFSSDYKRPVKPHLN